MPYITQIDRASLASGSPTRTPGHLNFELTVLINKYLETNGLSYTKINDVLGALEGAKLEFIRRIVNPYEDAKQEQNGDVYTVNGNRL